MIPETLEVRVTRFTIRELGRRVREIEVATTPTDADASARDDIAELYGFRWNTELDIRSIRGTLNLDHLRCKTPGDGAGGRERDDSRLQPGSSPRSPEWRHSMTRSRGRSASLRRAKPSSPHGCRSQRAGHLRPPCGNSASGCSHGLRRARSPTVPVDSNQASASAGGTAAR